MNDLYQGFTSSPIGKQLTKMLGLPQPTKLERYAEGGMATQALSTPGATQAFERRPTAQLDQADLPADEAPVAWVAPPAPAACAPVPEPAAHPEQAGDELVPWEGDEEESDWQAAWSGEAGQPDPRIGRPQRTGTLVALLALIVAGAAVLPVVTAGVAVLWSWAARTADRSVTSLVLRRYAKGRRRSDVPFAVAASPWHLVVGALATVVAAILPLVVGVCAVFSTALAVVAATGGSPEPNSALPLSVGALLAVLMAWWGPGGSGLRRGSRSIVRGVVRGQTVTRVVVLLVLAAAAAAALWSLRQGGVPDWWPSQPPSVLLPDGLTVR